MSAGGRAVLATGVSSGIGRALVREALRRGHAVSGCARRAERLAELERELGPEAGSRLHLRQADVNRSEEAAAWVEEAVKRLGGVDAVIHNAGFGLGGPVESLRVEDFREQFETNFFAVVGLTRIVLPRLRERGGGDIVMVSSILGRLALPGRAPYCASKFALEGYAEALRGEVRHLGIRVSVVNPGFTETEFGDAMKVRGARPPRSVQRAMSAETVARATLDCLGRTRRSVLLTGLGRVAVWVHAVAPGLIEWAGARAYRRELERSAGSGG